MSSRFLHAPFWSRRRPAPGPRFQPGFCPAGWDVACHYQHSRDEALQTCAEIEALGRKAWAIAGDMADAAAQQAVFSQAVQAIGRGPTRSSTTPRCSSRTPAWTSPELLQQQMMVNLVALLHLATLLARAVHQAPAAAPRQPWCMCWTRRCSTSTPITFPHAHQAPRWSGVALQAQALAPQVRVSAVAPGLVYVSGPQTGENFTAPAPSTCCAAPPTRPTWRTAAFLAENASITGITITVDKGQHLVPLERDIMFVAEQLAQAAPPGTP